MRPPHRWRVGVTLAALTAAAVVMVAPSQAASASFAADPGLPNPCDVPLVGALCAVPNAIDATAEAVVDLPASMAENVIEGFAGWIAAGAASFVDSAGSAILSGTRPKLSGTGEDGRAWFLERYDDMALVALGLFAPMLILAVLHGVFVASGALVWRAVANLPVAALGTAAAVVVVEALLAATDNASSFVARNLAADSENFLSGITSLLISPALLGHGKVTAFGVVLMAVFMAFAAFVVWLELVVREAAVYLTVAFLPLGFATYIWPALSSWLRRLIEVIVALVLSKLVIVVALSIAGSALAAQEGFAALVGGAGMLLLAAFAPFALFRLIPVASMATLSSLEGQGRRAARAAAPRMSSVFYARQLSGSLPRPHLGAVPGASAAKAAAGPIAARAGAAAAAAGPAAPGVALGLAAATVAGGAVRAAGGAVGRAGHQGTSAGSSNGSGAAPPAGPNRWPENPSRAKPPRPNRAGSERPSRGEGTP